MNADKIVQRVKTLRVRSRPDRRQQTLADIASACSQRQSKGAATRWVARAAIAAGLAIAVTYVAVTGWPGGKDRVQRVPPAAPGPVVTEIMTVRSLEKAFSRDGLDGVERQLDRAFELVGPWPTTGPEQGLL
jgi:hypothetical protein